MAPSVLALFRGENGGVSTWPGRLAHMVRGLLFLSIAVGCTMAHGDEKNLPFLLIIGIASFVCSEPNRLI